MQVSLSIWSIDQKRLAEEVKRYGSFVDSFHVDVMDGSFTDSILFGPLTVQTLRSLTEKPIVAHLMITEPSIQVSRFVDAGADVLAIHSSACRDMAATIGIIRDAGADAGIAVALDEPDEPVLANLPRVSQVIVMATNLGVKGKPFDQAALRRLALFGERKDPAGPTLFVDGGIRWPAIPLIARTGADGVVAGSIVTAADCPFMAAARIARY